MVTYLEVVRPVDLVERSLDPTVLLHHLRQLLQLVHPKQLHQARHDVWYSSENVEHIIKYSI